MTLKWTVKEQRTGTAQIGAGYSGGITGTGLTGNISYSENNINGTGNSATIRLEKGAQIGDASLSFSMPYLGDHRNAQKYSLGATIFTQSQTNYYPVYLATPAPAPGITSTPIPAGAPVPVSIVPADPTDYNLDQRHRVDLRVGGDRHQRDHRPAPERISCALRSAPTSKRCRRTRPSRRRISSRSSSAFNPLALPTTNPFNGTSSASNAIGIIAPSMAKVNSSQPYALRSLVLGIGADTRDDMQNPRNGWNASISEEVSCYCFGSAFNYTQTILDVARFFPVPRNSTIRPPRTQRHLDRRDPDQQAVHLLRPTAARVYQSLLWNRRAVVPSGVALPGHPDRKFSVVLFGDDGAVRIAGGQQINSDNSTTDLNYFQLARRRGGRRTVRHPATRAAHDPPRLRQGQPRHAHFVRYRTSVLR